jgi:hypothetical protein
VECKKDKIYKVDASKITSTDENGDLTGEVDSSDWRFDDTWNEKEFALFNFGDTVSKWGMGKATALSAIAAPNPASSVIMFTFRADQPTLLKIAVTDEYLNVIYTKAVRLEKYSNVDPNIGLGIDVRNSKFTHPGFYRIYYAFYSQDGILYKKGHGDFKKL